MYAQGRTEIHFTGQDADNSKVYQNAYEHFNKPHRLRVIKNKTFGVALINLHNYESFFSYLKTINGKNSPAYYMRKAHSRGYRFVEIRRQEFLEDIMRINKSTPIRQGRNMDEAYSEPSNFLCDYPNFTYYGVITDDQTLVAYADLAKFGQFCSISRILGHSDYLNDGIISLLVISIVKSVMGSDTNCRYLMYDTFFGGGLGLQKHKLKLGFKPYLVKWSNSK